MKIIAFLFFYFVIYYYIYLYKQTKTNNMETVEQKIKQVFEEIEAIKKAKVAPFLRCRQVIAGSVEEAIEIVGLVKTVISNNGDHSYLDDINLFAGASFGNCVMIQSKR